MKALLLAFLAFPLFAQTGSNRNNNISRFEQLTGVTRPKTQGDFWNQQYAKKTGYVYGKAPAEFLSENFKYLPENGEILDMGMGEGRNAIFLAQKGFQVTGVDISSVAVRKSKALAKESGVRIRTIVASLNDYQIPANSYDGIICYYWVDRSLIPSILKWLKPGGVLIYEAHTINQLRHQKLNTSSPDHDQYLKPGELLELFKGNTILKYEEPLHLPEFRASIIVQRPK